MSSSVSALNFDTRQGFDTSNPDFSPLLRPDKARALHTIDIPITPQIPSYYIFNSEIFTTLATEYKLTGDSLSEILEHNYNVK